MSAYLRPSKGTTLLQLKNVFKIVKKKCLEKAVCKNEEILFLPLDNPTKQPWNNG